MGLAIALAPSTARENATNVPDCRAFGSIRRARGDVLGEQATAMRRSHHSAATEAGISLFQRRRITHETMRIKNKHIRKRPWNLDISRCRRIRRSVD
jgi:hypothetical protein